MGKFSAVIKTEKRHSTFRTGFRWVCSLACGHTQEVQAVKKNRCEYKPAPVRLVCRQCSKESDHA